MSNRKITQLNTNTNPTLSDVFPIVNNNITKKLSLDGLVTFLTPYFSGETDNTSVIITGGTYNNNNGVLSLTNSTGGTVTISGFYTGSTEVFVTGGTYSASAETATFTNTTGGTFSVTGIPNGNTKKWKIGDGVIISGDESILVSGNYVLQDSILQILDGGNSIAVGDITFEEKGELYIGGNTFFNDTTINNDGIISIAGALILSGNTTITGTGIII